LITLIDSGIGNLGSVKNMLRSVGAAHLATSDANTVAQAEKLLLPGVGAFDSGIEALASLGLIPAIQHAVAVRRRPILGICLGMQLLGAASEEGARPGLNLHRSRTIRIATQTLDGRKLRVPHMGWNTVVACRPHALTRDLPEPIRFYFVHSYTVACDDPNDVLLECQYSGAFTAAFAHDNVMGVQFHPEKSHRFGMALLKNFTENV
jgi:glutamine amidotransferase